MLVSYRSGFNTDEELRIALHMATEASAGVMGKQDYGLKVGNEASFVLFKAPNAPRPRACDGNRGDQGKSQ